MKIDSKISICIPAYNRPKELVELLGSIYQQNYLPHEVIICEDNSPMRSEIREVVNLFKINSVINLRYIENEKNLGYDANLRKTISLADGDYVFLSGNDDLLAENCLSIVAAKIAKYSPEIIIRSYSSFYKYSDSKRTIHQYVNEDHLVSYNEEEVAWLFYRSVFVSGLVFRLQSAQLFASDSVDGTLYYQNYLLAKIFSLGKCLYVPDILVHNRLVDAGDFGSSEIESKGEWVPGQRTINSSIYQMKMFFKCSSQLECDSEIIISSRLKKIASAYSYPLISYHADKPLKDYMQYIKSLADLGYGGIFFYCYAFMLKFPGVNISNKLLSCARFILGHTKRIV
jgi:abequosyltransferase